MMILLSDAPMTNSYYKFIFYGNDWEHAVLLIFKY